MLAFASADRKRGEIHIERSVYVANILKRFNMSDCKLVCTPFDINNKLTNPTSNTNQFSNIPYQKTIGSLLHLVQGTRPDIAYAVNFLSKFNNDFDNLHWASVK